MNSFPLVTTCPNRVPRGDKNIELTFAEKHSKILKRSNLRKQPTLLI